MGIADQLRPTRLVERSRTGVGLGALRLAAVPFGLATHVLVSRRAGSDAMGEYAVMLSVIGVLSAVMNAGRPTDAARELPRLAPADHPAASRRLLGLSAAIATFVGAAWMVAGGPIERWLNVDSSIVATTAIWVCAAGAALLTFTGGLARGSGAFRLATVAESSWSSIVVGVVVTVAAFAGQLHTSRQVLVVRTVVVAVGGAWLFLRWRGHAHRAVGHPPVTDSPVSTASTSERAPLLVLSAVILASTLAGWVQGHLPFWRLSSAGDALARSEFAAIGRMTQVAALPATVVLMTSSPALARRGAGHRIDEIAIRRRVNQATAAVGVYAVVVGLSSAWLLDHVWQVEHRQAIGIASVLLISQLVHAGTGPCGYALIMAGRELLALGSTILGAIVALVIAWRSPVSYPASTAALAVGLGVVSTNLSNVWWCHRRLGLRTWILLPTRSRRPESSPAP